MTKNGYLMEAADLSRSMGKSLKGVAHYEEALAEMQGLFSAPDMKDELKAAKALGKLNAAMNEKGLDPKVGKKLAKFVEKNGETKVADRATKLLGLFG